MASSAAFAAVVLGVVTVPVFAAARSPRLAETLIRFPAKVRTAARRRPTAARSAFAALWLIAWIAALGATAAGTGKPALGIAVGAGVGAFVGAAASMAMTYALHSWDAQALGRPLSVPAPIEGVCAADLEPPSFAPAFPLRAMATSTHERWSRLEVTMRWVRNGCATSVVVVIMLMRAATVRGADGVRAALGIVGLALVLTAVAAYVALAFVRRSRERRLMAAHVADMSVARVCAAHDWIVGSLDPGALRRRWPGIPFFADDKDHRVRAFVRGTLGRHDLCVIDERGTPPGSSSVLMRETRQTVYVMSLPGTILPRLSVSARHSRYLPQQRVNRPLELEAFNRSHHIACADPAFVSAVMTPRMMSLLMAKLPSGAQVVISGDALAVVIPGRLRPSQLEATVELLAEATRLMPTYLLRQYSRAAVLRG